MKGANRYMKILLGTQSKIYVMLTHGKTHKYYFFNRMKCTEGSLTKSSSKISIDD